MQNCTNRGTDDPEKKTGTEERCKAEGKLTLSEFISNGDFSQFIGGLIEFGI